MKYNVRLEVSNYCNLRCPLCVRESPLNKQVLNNTHLSLDDVRKFLPRFFLHRQVNWIYLSGAVAEPSLNPELIGIVKYLKKYNTVAVDSNGSTRNVDWWSEFGATGVICTFAPDSIKPNNNKYRINSNTDKVIENMRAFVSAGGVAKWKFIPYAHNEDELEDQRKISNDIGAEFLVAQPYPIKGKTDNVENSHLFPKDGKLVDYTKDSTPHHYCKMMGDVEERLLEISPDGIVYPCCYVPRQLYTVYEDYFLSGNISPKVEYTHVNGWTENFDNFIESFVPLIEEQGGIESLSLHKHSIHEILSSPFYKSALKQSWEDKQHFCNNHCGNKKYDNHLNHVLTQTNQ